MTAAERRRLAELIDEAVRGRIATSRHCDGCLRWVPFAEFGRRRVCLACQSTTNAAAYRRRLVA